MNWKKEIDLLREKQKGDEYGLELCNCIEEVMKTIDKQDHSGMSFSFVSRYLRRLLLDKPIFPLTDKKEEWGTSADGRQNNRYSALFKEPDGTYSDVERAIFVDTYDGQDSTWNNSGVTRLIDEMFPIKLPYMPADKPYKVYGADMYLGPDGEDLTKEHQGSYNYTVAYYIETPEGKKIDLHNKVLLDER